MIGMDFSSWNDLTTAKKSWFITPDFIVSMGSNISSEDGEIHTTIENKSIKSDNEIIKNTDDKLVLKNPSSNLYTAFTTLDNNTLTTTTEKRVGSWDKDKTEISKNFIKSFINHGSNPKDSSYLYAIIPENKLDFIENFNKNDIKILSQNNFAHGINFKNITAINFWKESENKVGIFSSKSPIALLAIDNKNSISISVSDPTHKNSTVIFTIDGKYKLETINTNIKTIVSQNTTTITVSNLKNGATENFTLIPKES
ncbi:polysaccharide lyase family 8 super-sandwich domain-containing protein [Cetobacterium somerae]